MSTPPRLDDTASRVLSEVVGAPVGPVERLTMGVMTHKFLVRSAAGVGYVIRLYPPSRAHVVDYEPDLLRRCRAAGALVPTVIADSRSGPAAELAYMVYEFLPGRPLSEVAARLTPEAWARLAGELVAQLRRLRAVQFEGFGELSQATRARDVSWGAFVQSSLATGLRSAKGHGLLPDSWLKAIRRILRRVQHSHFDVSPGLVWGDIQFENILVGEDDLLVGLIDFEGVLSGDDLATLGYLFAKSGDSLAFRLLRESWSLSDPGLAQYRISLYAILRALRVAPYVHLSLPTGARHQPLIETFPGLGQALAEIAEPGISL